MPDGYLRPIIDPAPDEDGNLDIHTALQNIEDGESYRQAARGLNTTRQTLSRIHQNEDRQQWYLNATADDARVEEALQEIPE